MKTLVKAGVPVAVLAVTLAVTHFGSTVVQAAQPQREPEPFQQQFSCIIEPDISDFWCGTNTYTVPAGKRLVVEYVSGSAAMYQVGVSAGLNLGSAYHYLALTNPREWNQWDNYRNISQEMLGFAEAGEEVYAVLNADDFIVTTEVGLSVVVVGYLVPAN